MEVERKSRKPTMLKEFLRDDFSSCSSNGFRSFPRRSCYTSMRSLLEMDLKARDSYKKPTAKPMSAFQKASVAVISMVKHFQFSPKQSILLPRSFSRRLMRSFTNKSEDKVKRAAVVVKVKDILRWKSFRDLVEEEKVLDYSTESQIQTSITTTTTTTTTTSNSWSDSDFTSELHSSSGSSECSGENDEIEDCKKYLPERKKISKRRCNQVVEEDSMEKSHAVSKYEDKDQFSPVSVLNFPFEEDDESSSSSFQSSLDSMQRTKHKLMQKIRRFESLAKIQPLDLEKQFGSLEQDDSLEYPSDSQSNSINNNDVQLYQEEEDGEYIKAEEKARELLKLFNETTSKDTTNGLLLDFFREEIMERNLSKKTANEDDCNLFKVATDSMNGNTVVLDWGVVESRGIHINEMERGGMWRKFEEEKRELAIEMEIGVLNLLMDEMLFDLLS